MMKTEHMREFLELAAAKNYSAAAKKLFISQPTLSRRIQALEEELGYQLVDTSSHGVALTEYGVRAVRSFRKILKEFDSLQEAGRNLAQRVTGTLNLGVLYYAIDDYCSSFLEWFQQENPNIHLKCNSYLPQQLAGDLLNQKIDIGTLFSVGTAAPEGMRYFRIGSVSMIAMLSRENPLAAHESASLEELTEYPLIVLENDEYSAALTMRYLQANKVFFPKTVSADNVETVPWVIRTTGGIHITGESVRRQNASSVAYIPISAKKSEMSFGFVWDEECENPFVQVFFEELKKYYHAQSCGS